MYLSNQIFAVLQPSDLAGRSNGLCKLYLRVAISVFLSQQIYNFANIEALPMFIGHCHFFQSKFCSHSQDHTALVPDMQRCPSVTYFPECLQIFWWNVSLTVGKWAHDSEFDGGFWWMLVDIKLSKKRSEKYNNGFFAKKNCPVGPLLNSNVMKNTWWRSFKYENWYQNCA